MVGEGGEVGLGGGYLDNALQPLKHLAVHAGVQELFCFIGSGGF